MMAAAPAVVIGMAYYGMPAVAVLCLSMSTAMLWEALFNMAARRAVTIGDANAALIGMLLAMMLPATTPWWAVITGTFLAVVIGKQIYGGIGANPFNPVALSMAILAIAWKVLMDVDHALLNYEMGVNMLDPLAAIKAFGPEKAADYSLINLFVGRQAGGIGTGCGAALVIGGAYLMARGVIRWEIVLTYLAGLFVTALLFHLFGPQRFAGPGFHLLAGSALFAAFFLAPEDASSPVNVLPMLIYGAAGGVLTILIRNIGAYADGTVLAVLMINLINPLLDKIKPPTIGKVN
jgi:electron transport complex protein RnfD